jgi:tRNA(adenine34) deaminase
MKINNNTIPYYLKTKLLEFDIITKEQLLKYDYYLVFQWLKDKFPSINFNYLFDLFCIYNQVEFDSLTAQDKAKIKLEYRKQTPHYIPLKPELIHHYLEYASNLAKQNNSDIPIAAIIVKDGQIIAHGSNSVITTNNITHHAEIIAINAAAQKIKSHRLDDCDLYVTVEPCLMCAGAIIHSRIKRLIFGAIEPKTGAIISQYKVFTNSTVNKHTEVIGPIANNYAQPVRNFLQSKR